MGRAIAVMKQHGFHEPAIVNGLSPKHPLMVEASALGIDVEKILATAKDTGTGNVRGKQLALQAEIRAVKTARITTDWTQLQDRELRVRVRAIQAEKQRNDAQHEAAMLKERLKQADNGAGDWVEEREALLAQIATLEAKTAEPAEPAEAPRIQELQEQNARQADSIQSLQAQLQEARQGLAETLRGKAELTKELARAHVEQNQAQEQVRQALAAENAELHRMLAEWQEKMAEKDEVIQQLEAKIKGWEEAFKENTASYAALRKDYEGYLNRCNLLESDLTGYREANRKLVDANEHLQEQLDSADQREALPDEVQWLRGQVAILIGKLR